MTKLIFSKREQSYGVISKKYASNVWLKFKEANIRELHFKKFLSALLFIHII